MFKDTPAPIRTTFWKHALLYCAMIMFGLIWGIVIEDTNLLYLTVAIVALGAWRTTQLYQIIHHTKYRTVEGTVVSDVKCPLRSGHRMTIQMEDGSQIDEIISGGRLLIPAKMYRIYLHSSVQPDVALSLPEALKPAQTLLGYEMVD